MTTKQMDERIRAIKASASASESQWAAQLACKFAGDTFAAIATQIANEAHAMKRLASYRAHEAREACASSNAPTNVIRRVRAVAA